MKPNNTPQIETERVILRKFHTNDLDDMALLYSDKTVNKFLPWFPHASRKETEQYLKNVILKKYEKTTAYCYAVQLKANGKMIGYVVLHDIDTAIGYGDLGYALMKEYWGQGLVAECCAAVITQLKKDGFTYITATHDRENVQSGRVMQKLGMEYKYSYVEQWQPKNTEVTFRMYQLNFDGKDRTHLAFWNKYPQHFIENITVKSGEDK